MKRIIAGFMVGLLFLQGSVHAVLRENSDAIREEKVIPFYVESNSQEVKKELDISKWENVKVLESKVNQGEVSVMAKDEILQVTLSNGLKSKEEKNVKTGVLQIEDAEYDDEKQVVVITPKQNITAITDVYGAFSSAKILENGDIELKLKEDAVYREGFSKTKTGFSEVEIAAEKENRERNFVSDWLEIPYKIIEKKISVIGDTSTVEQIEVKDKKIRVHFSNGIPERNTEYETGGYTYFWIDRFQDGSFKKYNPNSVYATIRKKIGGEGKYLDEKQKDEIGLTLQNPTWTDFCGIVVNGKKYIYSFDKKKGIPALSQNELLVGKEIRIEEGKWNTERYTVKLSNAGVFYLPEGNLYSMGKLVPNTEGWGEEVGNQPWESKEEFLNPQTSEMETYVKHYKFYYGPEKKMAFGGNYTYPYACKLSYQHYLPVKLYSGGICYEYEAGIQKKDYAYSGYVKIEVDGEKTEVNLPPTSPYHITFYKGNEILSWLAGSDDKTPEEDLRYEVQLKQNEEWKTILVTLPGKTEIVVKESFEDIRIRTLDEEDLYSAWGKLMESQLDLTASVEPYTVFQGETIDLSAITKSFYDVVSVKAQNEALNIDVSLLSEEKKIPKFYEISYDFTTNGLENMRMATNVSGKMENRTFEKVYIGGENEFSFEFPMKKEFEKNGTVVLSNENQNNLPLDFFDSKNSWWHLEFNNALLFLNEVYGKKEAFIEIVNEAVLQGNGTYQVIPKLKINRFHYDNDDLPVYSTVNLEKDEIEKPITVTWKTDVYGVTEFHVFCGESEVFTFEQRFSEIIKNLKAFSGYVCEKKLTEYEKIKNGDYELRTDCEVIEGKELESFGFGTIKGYRILFLDTEMSMRALKRYQNLLDVAKTGIQEEYSTIYGNQVLERKVLFSLKNISVSENVKPGVYLIRFTATDSMGNIAIVEEPVQVKQKEEEMKDTSAVQGKNPVLGRLFYEKNRAYMEELKKPKQGYSTEGFLCAGETLVLRIELRNTNSLLVDLQGNESIKTLDSLTKRFLCKESGKYSVEELEANYRFPKILYPVERDFDKGTSTFLLKYEIPYKTKQTLHSWSTLKTSSLEEIDTNKLFERLRKPYELVLYPNQQADNEIILKFDVFERWDTVLNRDVSKYLMNVGNRKKVSLGRS